ncbi:MAG: hypothetical protein DRR04_10190 [Gammaproteobacteria bacterium]|nr:MAG: hypothetical protein DRR04_10190 [Gammaproteobacteria bacterium]
MGAVPGTQSAPIGNVEFVWALARALLALAASAIFLTAAYLTFSPELAAYRAAAGSDNIQPRTIPGDDLTIRLGTGGTGRDKTLHLAGLSQDSRAIVTRNTSLQASDYPFVEYTINNLHPGAIVYLIWKTAENSEEISRARLHQSGNEVTTTCLGNDENWIGTITEIGFDVYGDLRDEALVISSLRILPYSPATLLAAIWSDWTMFEAWDQTSINHLRGVPGNAILSPSVAIAAWAGLALLALGMVSLFKKAHNPIGYLAVIFIPWIVLDLLWQHRLSTQLTETKFLFQGKPQHERHLADLDADLYQYAQHLKSEVLPGPEARIFLLHDDKGERHNYRRLRTQFHLLPYNIYNYGSLPPRKHIRDGDYILVLGSINSLTFQSSENLMTWGERGRLEVEIVDEHPVGRLYQVGRGKAE